MRLLELVPCGRPAVEKDALPPNTSSETPEKWQRRRSSGRAGSAWRPSLGAIAENSVLLLKPSGSPVPAPGKAGKQSEKAGARRRAAKARPGAERNGFRHYDAPGVVPAFPPTGFMF